MTHETKNIVEQNAILVHATISKNEDMNFSLQELERLCETANLTVSDILTQNVKEITPATFIGSGKIEELKELVEKNSADIVIFNNELSGSQIKNISDLVGVKVIDRTMLILDIFAMRATSNEGKLQVALAQYKYTLPRLSGIAGSSGRFGSGGVGMRGPGETKLELDRRVIQNNITRLEKQIKELKENRNLRRSERTKNQIKEVAIVGYTNAGKSTLLNTISKAGIYADDKLFATLETTTRKLWLDVGKEIIITDTVGFIDKLPHAFVDAFASTLEEAKRADLILVVVDSTDKNREKQIEVVEQVLSEIDANSTKKLYIYNKIDKISDQDEIPKGENIIKISAKRNIGLDTLKQKILSLLWED